MDDLTPFHPLKLLRHAPKVEAMLRGDVVYPIACEIDLSNVCPHDCPFCSFGTSKSEGYRQQNWVTFPTERMLALLDELAVCGVSQRLSQSSTKSAGSVPVTGVLAISVTKCLNVQAPPGVPTAANWG